MTQGLWTILTLLLISSCGKLGELSPNNSDQYSSLSSDFYKTYKAYIYSKNPIANGDSPTKPNMYHYLDKKVKITDGVDFLSEPCYLTFESGASYESAHDCIQVLNDRSPATTPLQAENGSWYYAPNTDEFYQVNTYYHAKLATTSFLESMAFTYNYVHNEGPLTVPPATNYNMAAYKSFWFNNNDIDTDENTLDIYSKCYVEQINAFFDPSRNLLCMGYNDDRTYFRMVQDPSVIYHEMGHVFVKVMMNQRNLWFNGIGLSKLDYNSDLGDLAYDEAGAINEGIADYFSYIMTGREQIGEWGIGKFSYASRPITEDNSLHITQVQANGRLSYPDFLLYDNNNPTEVYEGIHTAGMITSHYLVSLTNEFKNQCSSLDSYSNWDLHTRATQYVTLLLVESLAEMGDLFGKGSDLVTPTSTESFTNLNMTNAFEWTQVVDPPTYRKFFRIFAKNIKAYMTDGLCPEFTIDESEELLDEYGLLLFKYYGIAGNGTDGVNDIDYSALNGNSLVFGRSFTASSEISVSESNRKKSTLVSKELIDLKGEGASAYIIDKKSTIDSYLQNLSYQGADIFFTTGLAGTEYNNDNLKISPGEVVAVSMNLFNNSNSSMSGVQIIASDWDHMYVPDTTKNGLVPCIYDDWPSTSEGGWLSMNSANPGDCAYSSRTADPYVMTAGNYPVDPLAPVCLVESLEENETQWVSQGNFRSSVLNLEDDQCLNNTPADGSDMNPHECLVRFLPGANHAFYSRVDAQKTWLETVLATGSDTVIGYNGLLAMEVNKWIQPGTTFNCRLRVKFSNCSDCFNEDGGDREYPAYELGGAKPYKLINFQFTVID